MYARLKTDLHLWHCSKCTLVSQLIVYSFCFGFWSETQDWGNTLPLTPTCHKTSPTRTRTSTLHSFLMCTILHVFCTNFERIFRTFVQFPCLRQWLWLPHSEPEFGMCLALIFTARRYAECSTYAMPGVGKLRPARVYYAARGHVGEVQIGC